MKIAARITDVGAVVHAGGDIEVQTKIFDIDCPELEKLFKEKDAYRQISVSVVQE